ncbi:MAG: 4Fe-4S dicluster domain-containing protein [Desulfobacterium sp.]|nr:4Fe-4S dicluster domain-containing protein [Desulfobacterium sp.]
MINTIKPGTQYSAMAVKNRIHPPDSHSFSTQCYACGICTSSCPVSQGPGGLDPRRIVHLANIGNLSTVLAEPSIWHCLDCRRCGNLCPNHVKPWFIISSLQQKALAEERISSGTMEKIQQLKQELVTVLANTLAADSAPRFDELFEDWERWATPHRVLSIPPEPVRINSPKRSLTNPMNHTLCLTCRECSSACPLTVPMAESGRPEFDPLYFIRCYVLGVAPAKASLWSCLGCESCSHACSQSVRGHLVIKALQEEQQEFFNIPFQIRITTTRERVFRAFVSRVDALVSDEV